MEVWGFELRRKALEASAADGSFRALGLAANDLIIEIEVGGFVLSTRSPHALRRHYDLQVSCREGLERLLLLLECAHLLLWLLMAGPGGSRVHEGRVALSAGCRGQPNSWACLQLL
jgi:hypothetical protein